VQALAVCVGAAGGQACEPVAQRCVRARDFRFPIRIVKLISAYPFVFPLWLQPF
jgi:hypothetical protein